MLKILYQSIHDPNILTRATLLRKHVIIKLTLLLACVISVPHLIEQYKMMNTLNNNITVISQHLPLFNTTQQSITKTEDITNASEAIQTQYVYYAYDTNNTLTPSHIQKLVTTYTLTIITQRDEVTYYFLERPFLTQKTYQENISTQSVQSTLKLFINGVSVSYIIAPFLSVLINILLVLAYNVLFTTGAHLLFLMRQKLVRFKHLWRVSLFASFGPYVILSTLKSFHLSIPFELFWIFLYIFYVQYVVLKMALNEQ